MKSISILSFFLSIAVQSFSQFDPDKLLYATKAEKYKKMKTTGIVLTVGGLIMTYVGIKELNTSAVTTVSNIGGYSQVVTRGKPKGGPIKFLLGTTALGTGVSLWLIGAHNKRKYDHKLHDNLSARFLINQQGTMFSLTYHFHHFR